MKIAIPVTERDPDSTISALEKRNCFALVDLDENARITTVDFFEDKDEMAGTVDILVVQDPGEEIEEFIEMGIQVLLAEFGSTIEDIHEAYMFTQLRELS